MSEIKPVMVRMNAEMIKRIDSIKTWMEDERDMADVGKVKRAAVIRNLVLEGLSVVEERARAKKGIKK